MEEATLILPFPNCHVHEIIGFILAKQEVRKDGLGANKNDLCQSVTIKTPAKLQASTLKKGWSPNPIWGCCFPHGLVYPWPSPWYFYPKTLQKRMACLSSTLMLFKPFLTLFHPLKRRTKMYCVKLRQLFAGKTSVFTDWLKTHLGVHSFGFRNDFS